MCHLSRPCQGQLEYAPHGISWGAQCEVGGSIYKMASWEWLLPGPWAQVWVPQCVTFHRLLGLPQTVVARFQKQASLGTESKGCQFQGLCWDWCMPYSIDPAAIVHRFKRRGHRSIHDSQGGTRQRIVGSYFKTKRICPLATNYLHSSHMQNTFTLPRPPLQHQAFVLFCFVLYLSPEAKLVRILPE